MGLEWQGRERFCTVVEIFGGWMEETVRGSGRAGALGGALRAARARGTVALRART